MSRYPGPLIAALIVGGMATTLGGYWLGRLGDRVGLVLSETTRRTDDAPRTDRQPLYYQDPSGAPNYAAVPTKDAQGRDYLAVFDEADAPMTATMTATITATVAAPMAGPATRSPMEKSAAPPSPATPQVLYYRNPMGLADTSPTPKRDSMGMAYVPVYADEEAGSVRISPDKIQTLGVRTETAAPRILTHPIRSVGTIAVDERRQSVVTTRFEGWIEKLYVNTTGHRVKRGDALAEIYSPDLILAEREYLIARQNPDPSDDPQRGGLAVGASTIADAALRRLKNWGISADQLDRLTQTGKVAGTLTLRAATSGQVLDKGATDGMHFNAGDVLFKLADLGTVWLMADVFEQDLALVQPGQSVTFTAQGYPDRPFTGQVDFIYPLINRETRTAKIRITLANSDGVLRGDMAGSVEIMAQLAPKPMLAVPESAILRSGPQQVVLLDRGDGRYAPRSVTLGPHADGYVAVTTGLIAGDTVVVSANFLIDAESNLRAALQGFTAPIGKDKTP